MIRKINQYVRQWTRCGYPADIPDAVPDQLMHEQLAPSYRQIAIAILKNDHAMQSLGFSAQPSPWYIALKREELIARGKEIKMQGTKTWRGFCVEERTRSSPDKQISKFFETRDGAEEFLLLKNKLEPPEDGAERFVSDGGARRSS